MKKKKAVTLLEILVITSILFILISILTTVFMRTNQNSHNNEYKQYENAWRMHTQED